MQRMVIILCLASFSMKAMDVLFGPSQAQLNQEKLDQELRDLMAYRDRKPIPDENLIELLDQGANPNGASRFGTTLLSAAALNSDTEACRILLEKGALINYPEDVIGARPLSHALTSHQNADLIRLLLQHGAIEESSSFYYAYNRPDISKLLIDYAWVIPPFEVPQQKDIDSLVALIRSLKHLSNKSIVHRDLLFTFIDSEPRLYHLFLRLLLHKVANNKPFPETFMGLPIPQRYRDIIEKWIYHATNTELIKNQQDTLNHIAAPEFRIGGDKAPLLERLNKVITDLEEESNTKELKENIVERMKNPPIIIHPYEKPTRNFTKLGILGIACTLGAYLAYRYRK